MNAELLKGLTEEQIAKIKSCKTQEEILKVAKEEGFELTDEQLEAVSGGCGTDRVHCPKCNGDYGVHYYGPGYIKHECWHCGYHWTENTQQ